MGKAKRSEMSVQQIADRLSDELPCLRREYTVRSLGLFGSHVRGEQCRGIYLRFGSSLIQNDEIESDSV